MAVARFDGCSATSAADIIDYVKRHINSITTLYCKEVLTDEDTDEIMRYLNAHFIHLSSLELPKNSLTSLSSISKTIQVQAATLRHLDLSENSSAMKDLPLLVEALTAGTNGNACRVVRLDLSNNRIGSKSDQIGKILERNTSITELVLAHNSLSPRHMKSISEALFLHNSVLRKLDLSHNLIKDSGVARLACALDHNEGSVTSLEDLNLTCNRIGPHGAEHIGTLLNGNNRTISKLNLSLNSIGPDGAVSFASVLQYNYRLQELNLSRNNIKEGLFAIAAGLKESQDTNLRTLDLSWNSLKDDAAKALANVLQGNSVLESLKLASNSIGDEGIKALVESLHANLSLTTLDIVGNQMRDASALVHLLCHGSYSLKRLAYEKNNLSKEQESRIEQAFQFRKNKKTWLGKLLRDISHKKLVSLELKTKHAYGDEEVMALSKQLAKYKPTVTTAFFHGSRVTDRGVIALARDVLGEATIQRLYLHGCSLRQHGIAAIAQAVASKQCALKCMSLVDCNIGVHGAKMLATALETNNALKRLSLESNSIGDSGATALLSVALDPPHPTLLSLNLANTDISDEALVNLGPLIKLEELHLDGNDITDYGALDLAKAVMGSKSLRWLHLSRNRLSPKGIQALNLFLRNEFILESSEQRHYGPMSH